MLTLFSCCMHRKDVAGSRHRVSGWGIRRAKPPEAETLLDFKHATEAANLPAV